ncbi:MAG: MBL fold metallo-hydrolase [Dehalococcoidia bacterium]
MRIGGLTVDLICDTHYKVDAGSLFGVIPKEEWFRCKNIRIDKRNRIRLGVLCLLIRTADTTILVDTGIGNRPDDFRKGAFRYGTSKLMSRLREKGVTPRSVDTVVLTHAHFTSAGGAVRSNAQGRLMPAFPNARYLIQRASWQEALQPSERVSSLFRKEDLLALEESGRLELLDGDRDIAPGVHLKVTHGHCPGHQVVVVTAGANRIAFLGALVPTPLHAETPWVSAFDSFPDDTVRCKKEIIALAERQGWVLVFPRWETCPSGVPRRINGRLHIVPYRL